MDTTGAAAGSAQRADEVAGAAALAADVCAVIVSGGSGERFGNPGGKQLVSCAGKPLMAWSILAFDRSRSVGSIVVVGPEARLDEMRLRAVEPFDIATPVRYATAGATRQDSTRAGVAAAPAEAEFIAIHDGARPAITAETIDAAIETLRCDPTLDGVVCGQPAVDTLKVVEDGIICDTPPRSRYWTVQTPQIFRRDALERAFAVADAEGFTGTDDASLVERAGGRVRCIESPRDNMKVTLPEDLVPVEAILRARAAQ